MMNPRLHETTAESPRTRDSRGRLVGGAVMIAAGVLLLAGQAFTLGSWLLIFLGLVFMAAGVATHVPGWFIPGGVVAGVGLGALVSESSLVAGETVEGGAFLLAFALGWVSIYVLTRIFTPQPLRWALIPGAVLATIGGALLLGDVGLVVLETVAQTLGYLWPVALVAGGIALILKGRRR